MKELKKELKKAYSIKDFFVPADDYEMWTYYDRRDAEKKGEVHYFLFTLSFKINGREYSCSHYKCFKNIFSAENWFIKYINSLKARLLSVYGIKSKRICNALEKGYSLIFDLRMTIPSSVDTSFWDNPQPFFSCKFSYKDLKKHAYYDIG